MSRVSRKSELSPSITRGSSGIDLGKNSGVDMGRKSEPSITSGGIGLKQEVTNIGGMSVSGGIEVDLTPVDFGVNYNASERTVSIATGAEIPGGLLGVSGGIEIDLNTGQVIGGSIGGEVGGLGINVSNSQKGGLGIEFTLQIPGTPIELSIGFGFPPKDPELTLTPGSDTPISWEKPIFPTGDPSKFCTIVVAFSIRRIGIDSNGNLDFHYEDIGTGTYDLEKNHATGQQKIVNNYPYPIQSPDTAYYVGGFSSNTSFSYPSYPGVNGISLTADDGYQVGLLYRYYGRQDRLYNFLNSSEVYYQKNLIHGQVKIIETKTFQIIHFSCTPGSPTPTPTPTPSPSPLPPPSPFPNPPPRRQKKVDECCRLNLAFLRLIYTKLGLAKFPGQLPNTIIQEVAGEGEEPSEPPQVPIPDLVSLLNWTFERDDERWGQWVVQINVKDSDITKEGDQSKPVKFPNLAESIAEIEGQILSLSANVDALVAITTKNLVESGLGRQEAIKGYLAAKSIIKYMAFKTTEIDVDIPACFTPEAQTIHELVNESTIHFKGIDYTEKETLRDIYLDLLQAAAIIRAVHWQRIDTKRDTKTQLLELLKGTAGLANSVKNPTTPNGTKQPKSTQDFEDFIDTVEDGFRNVAGVADAENPYGKTSDRRPRIRQIGENISQAGGKS